MQFLLDDVQEGESIGRGLVVQALPDLAGDIKEGLQCIRQDHVDFIQVNETALTSATVYCFIVGVFFQGLFTGEV